MSRPATIGTHGASTRGAIGGILRPGVRAQGQRGHPRFLLWSAVLDYGLQWSRARDVTPEFVHEPIWINLGKA
jgi:hypothetical protein